MFSKKGKRNIYFFPKMHDYIRKLEAFRTIKICANQLLHKKIGSRKL